MEIRADDYISPYVFVIDNETDERLEYVTYVNTDKDEVHVLDVVNGKMAYEGGHYIEIILKKSVRVELKPEYVFSKSKLFEEFLKYKTKENNNGN